MLPIPTISPRLPRARMRHMAAVLALLAIGTGCAPKPEPEAAAQPAQAQPAAAAVGSDEHGAHDAHAATPADAASLPPQGQRWATDAPLRAGMASIRQAVGALEHGVHGHLDATQQQAVAKQVDAAVAGMIANCKLEPQADEALHGLLASFIAGATAAREGRFGQPELAAMQAALAQYSLRFDDPAWNLPAPE